MNTYLPRNRNYFAILINFILVIYSSVSFASSTVATDVLVGINIMGALDCKYAPSDDCISREINLPFNFPFYGQTYSKIYIDTNGFITLRQPSNYNPGYVSPTSSTIDRDIPKASNTTFPTITPVNNPDAVIAPFWDDLDLSSSRGIIRYAAYPDRLIVQWADAGFWKVPLPMGTFQVILYDSGEIQFQYPTVIPQKASQTRNKGGKATIGIENETGTCGVKYSYKGKDGAGNPKYVASKQAIRFTPATAAAGCPVYQMNENATYNDILLSDTPPTPLPSVPTLIGATPADGATGVLVNIAFDWADATYASKYRLLVSTDPNFIITLNPLSVDADLTTSNFTTTLQPNTTYYWTVVALNSLGDSAWATEILSFTTTSSNGGATTLPTAPDLTTAVIPVNQAVVARDKVSFDWQSVVDASSYQIVISTEADIHNLNTALLTSHVTGLTDSSYIATGLQPNTTYYWTVMSTNRAGSTWANAISSFTTLPNLPIAIDMSYATPSHAASGVATHLNFTWQAVAEASSYRFVLSTQADLTTPVIDSEVNTNSYSATNLQANTTYYWTVAAINAAGKTQANYTYSFTTENNSTGGNSGNGSGNSGDSGSTHPGDISITGTGTSGHGWAGYSVILHKTGSGTGRIVEQNCPINSYNPVTLYTALPDQGSRFVRWEGNVHSADCYSTQASIAVTVNAIKTCTAVFEKLPATEKDETMPKTGYNRYSECKTAYQHVVAAYYLPSATQTAQAEVQLTNDNKFPMEVRGSLYHETGRLLGRYNTILVAELAPHTTKTFSMAELAKQVGAADWEGLAWLHITTPDGIRVVNTLKNENKVVENMNLVAENTAYNLPSSAQTDEQAFVVVVNLTNDKVDVYGSLYHKNGELLGNANSALTYNIPARGIRIVSMKTLEYMAGASGWDGRARLQITAPIIGIKVFNLLLHRDGTLTNMSAVADNNLSDLSYGTDNFVRITNPTDTMTEVKGTLLNDKDEVLGQQEVVLATLMPQQTMVLSTEALANKLGAPAWQKTAKLVITAPTTVKLMGTARVAGILTNIAERIPLAIDTAPNIK